jgi:glycosyltransferase involved in cell wall biosynthesis
MHATPGPNAPLVLVDPVVRKEVAVGGGTALLLRAWCITDSGVGNATFVVNGLKRTTTVCHQVAPVGFAGAPPLLGTAIWATLSIDRCDRDCDLEVSVQIERMDGRKDLVHAADLRVRPQIASPFSPPALPSPAQEGPIVCICMTTYNPPLELFRRQIESIRNQSHRNWICIVCDDCSQLELSAAIESVLGNDDRFHLYRNEENLGFYYNFERALALVPEGVPFVALSDQDDFWHEDKLATLVDAMDGGAMLAYSDMNIVDSEGNTLSNTYWTSRLNNYTDLTSLIIANTVTGAASIFRRELLNYALPFPQAFRESFHDHWLACVALMLGKIAFVNRPLYDYVQHGANVAGHSAPVASYPLATPLRLLFSNLPVACERAYREHILRTRVLTETLLQRAGPSATRTKRRAAERLANLEEHWASSAVWLGIRGLPGALKRTVTMGLEIRLTLGLLWFGLLRSKSAPR